MTLVRKYIVLVALIFLFTGCSSDSPSDRLFGLGSVLDPVPTPTNLQLTITTPDVVGAQAGWQVYVAGGCSPAGGTIRLVTSGEVTTTICNLSGQYSGNVDISAAPLGVVLVTAYLEDSSGNRSTVETASFNKITLACDSPVDRLDTYANFSTGGDGGATPWVICTRQQFQNVNLNRTDNFIVQNDIDYEQNVHIPFTAYYEGDFNGAGFTIRNMLIASAGDNVGIFSQIRGPANIHDIQLDTITVAGRNRVAALVGWVREESVQPVVISNIGANNINVSGSSQVSAVISRVGRDNVVGRESFATISNIIVNNSSLSGSSYVAGVIGYVVNTLGTFSANNFSVSNTEVSGSGSYVGGVIGRMDETAAVLADFEAISGSVTVGTHYGGGVIGELNSGILTNFNSSTNLTANGVGRSYFGGLIGLVRIGAVLNGSCNYIGSVSGNDNSSVGGAIGYLDNNVVLDGCSVDAIVTGRDQVGGVVGRTDPFSVVRNINAAPATAKSVVGERYVGGIIGYFHQDGILEDSIVNSSVTATTSYAGGATGYHRARITIDSVFASGNVISLGSYAGGLIGGSADDNVVVIESGAIGDVEGVQFVGGLAGRLRINGLNDFTNNFAAGNVRGNDDTGGIIGYVHRNVAGVVNKMYSTGRVIKITGSTGTDSRFGAIAGRANSATAFTNTSLFFDSTKSVLDEASGLVLAGQNTYGTAVSDAALQTQSTYTTLPADFTFPVWDLPVGAFSCLEPM